MSSSFYYSTNYKTSNFLGFWNHRTNRKQARKWYFVTGIHHNVWQRW